MAPAHVARLFAVFGIDIAAALAGAEDEAQAFESAKAEAKRSYKRLASQRHPDHGGDAVAFRALAEAHRQVQALTYRSPRDETRMLGIVITIKTGPRRSARVETVRPKRKPRRG